jgi:hypothetical protein
MARILCLLFLGCNHAPLPAAASDLARGGDLLSGDLAQCVGLNRSCYSNCCPGLYCRILHDGSLCLEQCGPAGYPCVMGADCCSGGCGVVDGGFEPTCK